jgi:hypothetical protein
MWSNDLQKWQNGGEIITKPARFACLAPAALPLSPAALPACR